jgi:hypothetical protein
MTLKTITLSSEDASLLGRVLTRALDAGPANPLSTGDEPGVRALLSDLQAPEDGDARQPSLLDPVPHTLFADRLFSEEDVTGRYARKNALADGALVDVSAVAEEAGFLCPVAVTAALMADIEAVPESKKGVLDNDSRVWDVVYIGEIAGKILQDQNERRLANGDDLLGAYVYQITMPLGRRKKYNVKLSLGFGDHQEPVATLMKPDES